MDAPSKKRLKLTRFKAVSESEKEEVLNKRKAQNTNKVTKLWIDCFSDYLHQKQLPQVEDLTAEQLPNILENFYVEVRSQKQVVNDNNEPILDKEGNTTFEEYTNNSLRSLHAGFTRYFRLKLQVNIMDNLAFIRANELFQGKMRMNKQEGNGTTKHKQPITEADILKLNNYFRVNMDGPPNGINLQEIILFNIIFYMGRRGRENLRSMKKDTFQIKSDSNGHRYIFQCKDESDKNHDEKDTEDSNQARIYETPGNFKFT